MKQHGTYKNVHHLTKFSSNLMQYLTSFISTMLHHIEFILTTEAYLTTFVSEIFSTFRPGVHLT